MAKKLNKNLVVGLSLLGFVLILALSTLMLMQLRTGDPQRYVALAEEHSEKGDWKRASLFYSQAWAATKDPAYLVRQGEMALKSGDTRAAMNAWTMAITDDPKLIEAHVLRIEVLLEMTSLGAGAAFWGNILEAAEELLKADEGNAFAHHAKGRALIKLWALSEGDVELGLQGNEDKGVEELKRAIELAPEILDYALELAAYYGDKERIASNSNEQQEAQRWRAETEAILLKLLDDFSTPGSEASKVRQAYAQFLVRQEKLKEAEDQYLEAINLAGEDRDGIFGAKLAYAMFVSAQWGSQLVPGTSTDAPSPLFDKAKLLLEECIEAQPDWFDPYQQLALIYHASGHYEDAIKVCEARLARGFSRQGLEATQQLIKTINLYLRASRAAVAAASRSDKPEDRDRWLDQAELFVEDARAEAPNDPRGLSQEAHVKLVRGYKREALELYRLADEGFMSRAIIDWPTKIALARIHLALDESGAAKAVLENVMAAAIVQRAGDASFWVLYAEILFRTQEMERALSFVDRALQVDPESTGAIRLKAAILSQLNRHEEADLEIRKVATDDGMVVAVLEAEALLANDDVQGAISALRKALESDPANPRLLAAAIPMMLREDNEGACQVLENALEVEPDNLAFQRMLVQARVDLTEEERDQAVLKIIELEQDAYARIMQLLDFHYAKGHLQEMIPLFEEAESFLVDESTPAARKAGRAGLRKLLMRKLLVAARLDNETMLKEAVDSAALHNADNANGKTILGQYHMYREEADLAIAAFTAALVSQPTNSRVLSYVGRCYQNLNRVEDAQACFERAVDSNPNEGIAHKGLAQLAQVQGDRESFEMHLSRCLRLIPGDPWVQAEQRARQEEEDPVSAIARREKELESNPDDVANLRRLAFLSDRAGEALKAEQYYKRLLELNPDDQNLNVAVSDFYHRIDRHEDGAQLLMKYAESRPTTEERANALIPLAAHYLKRDGLDKMEATLREAADFAETFEVTRSLADFYFRTNRPRRAMPWYDKAVARGRLMKSPRLPQTLSARIGCLLHHGLNDTEMARQRIEEFRRDYPEEPRGVFWQSELAARFGEIDRAIAALTAYLEMKPYNSFALYQRALHEISSGERDAAIADLETLREKQPDALGLRPRILLANLYEQSGRKDLQLRELETLFGAFPDTTAVIEGLVNAYIRDKRLGEAEQILTSRINADEEHPNPQWLFRRGDIAAELNDYQRAVRDYHSAVQHSNFSEQSVVLILDLFYRFDAYPQGSAYFQANRAEIPAASSVITRYAALLALSGQADRAIDEFRYAMSLAIQEGGGASRQVAQTLVNRAFNAEEAITRLEQQAPDPAFARANERILILLKSAAGRTEEIRAAIDRLITTAAHDRERAELLTEEGAMLQAAGDLQGARHAYEESIGYYDRDFLALNNLAYLLSDKLGEHKLALPYAQQASVLTGKAEILDTLGSIHLHLAEYRQAIGVLSRAIQNNPGYAEAYYHLGEAYRQDGKFAQSQNVLEVGVGLARSTGDTALVERITASLEKVELQDPTP